MTTLTMSHWPAHALTPLLETTVGGVLRAAAWRAPDRVALIDGDRRWTYGELRDEAERVARGLLTRFAPGEPVAVWAGNGADWVLLEFAAGLAGLTLVTVNPAYKCEELAHVLGHSGRAGCSCGAARRPGSWTGSGAPCRGCVRSSRWAIGRRMTGSRRCRRSSRPARRRSCTPRAPRAGPRRRC